MQDPQITRNHQQNVTYLGTFFWKGNRKFEQAGDTSNVQAQRKDHVGRRWEGSIYKPRREAALILNPQPLELWESVLFKPPIWCFVIAALATNTVWKPALC